MSTQDHSVDATKTVETPTPRTDAECAKLPEMYRNCEAYTEPVSSDFARQLERELIETRQLLNDTLRSDMPTVERLTEQLAAMTKERDALREEVSALKSKIIPRIPYGQCVTCDGSGMDFDGEKCEACKGSGVIPGASPIVQPKAVGEWIRPRDNEHRIELLKRAVDDLRAMLAEREKINP